MGSLQTASPGPRLSSLLTHLTPPMSIPAPSAQSSGRQGSEEAVRGLEQEGSGSSFFGKRREKRERENKEKAERGGRCEDIGGRERQMTDRGEAESFQELQTDAQRGDGQGEECNRTKDIEVDK